MAFRGVFFDLYGTLIAYGDMTAAWADWLSALHSQLTRGGLTASRHDLAIACDGFFARPEPPTDNNGLTVYERRIRHLCRDLGLEPGPEVVHASAARSLHAWEQHVSLAPDAIPVLNALKPGRTLALISNFDHPPHVQLLLSELGLAPFFDAIVISGEVGFKKPDPRIFSPALRQTGLAPSEVAYVGDTDDDMAGARAAGLSPIRVVRRSADRVGVDFTADPEDAEAETLPTLPIIRELSELLSLC